MIPTLKRPKTEVRTQIIDQLNRNKTERSKYPEWAGDTIREEPDDSEEIFEDDEAPPQRNKTEF